MATWGGYDGAILATRFQKTFIKDYLDLSGRLDVRNYDVSLNNRLFVMNDASFTGNVYVGGNLIANIFVANSDVSLNNRLFITNDASFMSNVYVDDILTVDYIFASKGDVSLNSNVFVGKDISSNGNVSIGKDLTVAGNLIVKNNTSQNIINTTTTNYQLVVSEDLSLNGRLCVLNDASMNGNLFVSGNISLNGNLKVKGYINFLRDISINGMNIGSGNSTNNTIIGFDCFKSNTTGVNNTAIGHSGLMNNTTGRDNTMAGVISLVNNTTGSYNTGYGYAALEYYTTGSYNTGMGYRAGYTTAALTGSYNTYIGSTAMQSNTPSYNNSTAVGLGAVITGNNQIVLGRDTETVVIPRIERHLALPIIMRKALSSQSQSVDRSTGATVTFPTLVYDNGYTGITYLNGVFTNTNSYSVCLNISASVNFPAISSTTAMVGTYIQTSGNSTYTSGYIEERHGLVFDRVINNIYSQHITLLIPLAAGATFWIGVGHTVGTSGSITISGSDDFPTFITIHVF